MNQAVKNYSTKSRWKTAWHVFSIMLWMAIALSFTVYFLIDLRLDFSQLQEACSGPDCNWLAISSAEETVLNGWGLSTLFYSRAIIVTTLLTVLVYWIVGGLIFWRQSHTRIGWTASLSLFVIPINLIADVDNVVVNYPELTPFAVLLAILGSVVFVAFFLLFPNGQFVPRWSVIFLVIFIIFEPILTLTYSGVIYRNTQQPLLFSIVFFFLIFQIGLIIFFQIYRYFRVSTLSERLQTKWVLFGFVVLLFGFPVWAFLYGGIVTIPPGTARLLASGLGWFVIVLMTIILPITIAISISRYKLWNIDRIIRGSLIYALLTGTLLLIFFGSVVILQSLFATLLGGEQSQLIIIISTLLVAALLNPLRGRFQSLIDRRFFRQKYDAQQALVRFSTAMSSEVDNPADIEALLLRVLDETIQPSAAAVWLRDRSGS